MNWRWVVAILVSCVVAATMLAIGLFLQPVPSFVENMVAEIFGLAAAFAIAVFFIEGSFLTQQARRRSVVNRMAKSILREADEIGMMISWELGKHLAWMLESNAGLENEGRGDDWDSDVKPLLCLVFAQAEQLEAENIRFDNPLPYENYRETVDTAKHYTQRILSRIENNIEVNERLIELAEVFYRLDAIVTRSMWHTSVHTEVDRIRSLGRLGNVYILVMETIGAVHTRLR